jgi:hypothetical protein
MTARTIRSTVTRGTVAAGLLVIAAATHGAPMFEPAASFELSGSNPKDCAAADVNNDGFLDFIVTMYGCEEVAEATVLLGDGAGGFFNDFASVGGAAWGIVAADVNEDGNIDLITTQGGGGSNAINVRLGNGTGVFPLGAAYTVGAFPIAVVAGDFNGDAHLDLAVANNVTFGLTILIGDGKGAFSGPFHVAGAGGYDATDLVAADLDGDGDLDLALAHYGGVTTFIGNGAGGFTISGGAGSNVLTECVDAGDLDGDGDIDIVSGTLYGGTVIVRLNTGAGTFGGGPTLFVGSFLRDVRVVDLDGDGDPDLVAVNQDGGVLAVFENLGNATFGPIMTIPIGLQPDGVVAGDFNGDGAPDLVAANRALCDTADAAIVVQIPGPPPPPCPADLDDNGAVGAPDLAIMLATWGPAPGHPADLDDDGAVGPADLAILLAAWGPCP